MLIRRDLKSISFQFLNNPHTLLTVIYTKTAQSANANIIILFLSSFIVFFSLLLAAFLIQAIFLQSYNSL